MPMGLFAPRALYLFAIVPALILAYLARERPNRAIVSSAAAFRALHAFRRERFGGRPRVNWMFFAELLILSLAVLAAAAPFISRPSHPIALVIDNSAAMQARDGSGSSTRFADAIVRAAAMLESDGARGSISIFTTAPEPRRIGEPYESTHAARSALERLNASDAPNDQTSVAAMIANLVADARYAEVIFAGANPVASPAPSRLRAIAVGASSPNAGIGSFTLRREAFGSQTLRARVTIGNFTGQPRDFDLAIVGDEVELGHARLSLGSGETGAVEFPALAPAAIYRTDLKGEDSLALDNTAWAAAGAVRPVAIAFVTPVVGDSAGLAAIPGVTVKVVSPESFSPADLDGIDLAVFQYGAPKEIPPVNSLIVMPPGADPVFGFSATPANSIEVAGWNPTDALTDGVNFRLLNLRSGEYLGSHEWMSSVITAGSGALMMKGERGGHRFIATGFNPFPYLGRGNLPMSVLTLNVLGYLAGLGQNAGGYHTGEPWLVPAGVRAVIAPSGRNIDAAAGTLFTEVDEQGIYNLVNSDGTRTPRAVNLGDLTTSDLDNRPALKINASSSAAVPATFERRVLSDSVLYAIIALAALEAMIIYRRRRIAADSLAAEARA
jgi:hypothetical protein